MNRPNRFLLAAGAVVLTASAAAEVVSPALDLGSRFNELSREVVTPHVPWARPLPDGPVRALFLIARDGAREAVELAQRVDIEFDAVLFYRPDTFGHPRSRASIAGATEADKAAVLRGKLAQPWDLIVIGRVQHEAIPDWARHAIAQQVEGGAALLVVFPDAAAEAAWAADSPNDALDLAARLPLSGLETYRDADDPASLLHGGLTLHPRGAGRVALWRWAGFRPGVKSTLTPDRPMPDYEYHQALLARLVLHLAGRALPADPELEPADDSRLSWRVAVPGNAHPLDLEITVRDPAGRIVHRLALALAGDAATFALPPLPGGGHFLDVIARRDGAAAGWVGRYFAVPESIGIESFSLEQDVVEADRDVTGTLVLDQALADGKSLRLRVRDNHGREVSEQIFPSGSTASFSLPVRGSLTRLNEVVAEVFDGDRPLLRRALPFSIPRREAPDDFLFVGWGGAADQTHLSRLAARELKATGLDGYSGGGFNREGVRGPAIFNQAKIPYAWRVAAHFPAHVTDGVREPCLTDPAWRAAEREKFLTRTRECDAFGVPAYHLGDESYYMLFDSLHGLGSCYSLTCRAGFRTFLAASYGTIDALNDAWDSTFATWDEVDIRGPGDYPAGDAPRMDHLLYIAHKFTDAHRMAVETIQEVDPTARVGLEGLEALDAAMGVDWYPLLKMFRLLGVYPYPEWTTKDMNRHCVRSFAEPGTLLGMWYGGYIGHRTEIMERWYPWYALFLGYNSAWWYDTGKPGEMYNALAPDLSLMENYRQTTEEIAEIKAGVGKLVVGANRVSDPVAVHYSHRSFAVDHLELPLHYERRPGMYKVATAGFINILEDLGLSFDMVDTREIERGDLQARGYRVLIMPTVQALTDRETEQIKAFVADGGMVVADWLTGIRDGHGKRRESFPIDEVFGIVRNARMDIFRGRLELAGSAGGIDADLVLFDRELELFSETTTAEPLGSMISFKAGMVNRFGSGLALYLGFPIEGYVADRYRGHAEPLREFFRRVLAAGGVEAPMTVRDETGALDGMKTARFARGPIEVVLAYRDLFLADRETKTGRLHLGRTAHVYDLRDGGYIGHTDRVRKRWPAGRMEALALLPYRVQALRIEPEAVRAARGGAAALTLTIETDGGAPGDHVVRILVRDPAGLEVEELGRNLSTVSGTARIELPFALNDPPGRWTVQARDVISGSKQVVRLQVD